ncbi:glycoside hydrolase family 88/105 protein [Cryobacterium sp. 5B3]|uniref:beta-galactosidase BglB n=1 Tax=Cryobacterium sp. 5B3 TaxID=3048586 RepID=UPI002AB5D0EC|nr:glycoside hydrolase family 88 protein [Cryobacterium sp. 5B3]MDY7542469.1 glycoside hydrolase family 88 protein [Cryobacterium sp. 5B3]MEB0275308.1 glycoside hydrolase family 88 protein [Cryobacterium sp. 5B3]
MHLDTAVSREQIVQKIDAMISNLTTIRDESGKFLLHFSDVVVDDKSWNVWNWPQGVGLYGIYKNYRITGNPLAADVVREWFDTALAAGAPPKNVNTMAPLLAMACLYEDTKDSRYIPYLNQWAQWAMHDMPRTHGGGMQHMTYAGPNSEQLWDDTLMMTVLPLAKIGRLLDRPEYIEEAKYQFLIHAQYLMDKKTGLWFHGWSFERRDNYADALWARGNCWITIAIPELIGTLGLGPGDPIREWLLEILNSQVSALAELQDESGMWHTLLDDPTSYLESSATAGIAYGLLKAVHERYIDKSYAAVAEKAVAALYDRITDEGEVQNVSVGTGMGDDLDFYKNIDQTAMPYGQSLTVLCFAEYLVSFC